MKVDLIIIPGTIVLYNSPTSKKYCFKNGWNVPKKAKVIGQDKDSFFTREYEPGKFTGFHKSRLIEIINPKPNKQLTLF